MASTYGNKWTWVTVYCIFVYEIASTVGLCVGIIALQYSYCIVTPVKVTKGTSAHPAADVADESLRFYFLERERGEVERDGDMEIGINMEIKINCNLWGSTTHHLLCSASAYTSSELCYLSSYILLISCFISAPTLFLLTAGGCYGQGCWSFS